jgi:phosphoribosylformylglycinamidine (FGAM) synthase-like amidotransferase family enzyme
LAAAGQVPLRYVSADGTPSPAFPDNPNGAEAEAAAVCNGRGNVLAVMPHPERAQDLGGMARSIGGPWAERRDRALAGGDVDAPGPGLGFFEALARHLKEC